MADQKESEGHPVVSGLLALLGVGLAVGLLVSGGALAATSVLGLGDSDATSTSTSDASVYVPKPEPTEEGTGALVTLAPKPTPTGGGDDEETEEPEPEDAISLSASATAVAPGQPIDLSGVYPGHEGATLVVQRFEEGEWVDFADGDVTTTVSDETFSTYVITERTGLTRWRMRDVDTGDVSNEVRVKIG